MDATDRTAANSDARKRKALRVKVTVDTDELREWAGRHADAGHHGVAHVLYQAANEGESLTEQALREAERRGAEQVRAEAAKGEGAGMLTDADREAERDRLKRGGAELGKSLVAWMELAKDATGSADFIDEDGDGDWGAIAERMAEIPARLDAATARAEAAEQQLADLRDRIEALLVQYDRPAEDEVWAAETNAGAALVMIQTERGFARRLRALLDGSDR